MLQKAQRFQGQLRVNLTSNEKLPPSLGGRYTPVSKLYFRVACVDIRTPCVLNSIPSMCFKLSIRPAISIGLCFEAEGFYSTIFKFVFYCN
jgi:hypothetical protein